MAQASACGCSSSMDQTPQAEACATKKFMQSAFGKLRQKKPSPYTDSLTPGDGTYDEKGLCAGSDLFGQGGIRRFMGPIFRADEKPQKRAAL